MINGEAIGGFFELELPRKNFYHPNAVPLNTARNAFEYILLAKGYKKVYLPYFTCDVMLEPLKRNNIDYEFYNIDEHFEPLFDYSRIECNAVLLYTNYFALKDEFIKSIVNKVVNLIIDNAQSFYSLPLPEVDTFYSARKFFGVPDGGYLYTDRLLNYELEKDSSSDRCSHLLRRIDLSAEEAYLDFNKNDKLLENASIKKMSSLTTRLLESVSYNDISVVRKNNFEYLHAILKDTNILQFDVNKMNVPMVYPYWAEKGLREKLLLKKIYTAIYWPNVMQWCNPEDLEFKMTEEIVYLPIDQRLSINAMNFLIASIKGL